LCLKNSKIIIKSPQLKLHFETQLHILSLNRMQKALRAKFAVCHLTECNKAQELAWSGSLHGNFSNFNAIKQH